MARVVGGKQMAGCILAELCCWKERGRDVLTLIYVHGSATSAEEGSVTGKPDAMPARGLASIWAPSFDFPYALSYPWVTHAASEMQEMEEQASVKSWGLLRKRREFPATWKEACLEVSYIRAQTEWLFPQVWFFGISLIFFNSFYIPTSPPFPPSPTPSKG